jgi:hypothetical protein
MLLLRLRCYLPSTSAVVVTLAVAFVVLHGAAGFGFAGLSLATKIVIGLGLAGLAAGTIVISAVTIQRRRAAAGACHACSHPCRGAMVPLPERDTRRWPHRSLTELPGELPPARQPLALTVVSTQLGSGLGARSTWTERGRTTTGSPVCLGNSRAAETAGS